MIPESQIQYEHQKQLWEELKGSQSRYRLERKFLIASDIGSQYYCEQKLEYEYIHGKTETPELALGGEGHETIIEEFEITTPQDLWDDIYTKDQLIVAEFLLISKYKDVYLAGRPDILFFINRIPILLFEFKFSKYTEDFPGRHAQAQTYAMILKQLGFNCDSLFYSIIVFPPEMRDQPDLIKALPHEVISDFLAGKFLGDDDGSYDFGEVKVHIFKFDVEEAEKNIDWAIAYWQQHRDALPTENELKCASCEFSEICRKFNFES